MKGKFKLMIGLSLASAVLFTSCKKEGCMDPNAVNFSSEADEDDGSCEYEGLPEVVVSFSHEVDGENLVFDDMNYMNAAGNQYTVETLKYMISDMVFHSASGDVLVDAAHYVDGEDASSMTWSTGVTLPARDYTSVSFIFGLVEDKNYTGYFTEDPFVSFAWPEPMGGGYHYMKLEGKYDSAMTGTIKPFLTHFGPSMGEHYMVNIALENSNFAVEGEINNRVTVQLRHNINNWYVNPNTWDLEVMPGPIMGNQAAQELLQQNGIDVFSLDQIKVE